MEHPLPSTSTNSCSDPAGSLSPTFNMASPSMRARKINGPAAAQPAGVGAVGATSDGQRLLDQAGHDPRLGLRDRPALGDLDDVAELVLAVLVVRVVLARLRDDLAVQLVLGATLDQDRDRL